MLNLLGKSLGESNADTFELVSRRKYDAPQHVLFQVWTKPELLAQWWGPNGFTNTFHSFDLKPGGIWEFTMHGPNGVNYPNRCLFQEIEPDRIVIRHDCDHYFTLTATFEEVDGGTELTFRQAFDTAKDYKNLKVICEEANEQNLDRIGALLKRL
ncbi:SRPBCC family protein [Paenibacillus sp. N1-5-1-14]|nr:SRPBCC family protein [Paenibacillus radicibacter]